MVAEHGRDRVRSASYDRRSRRAEQATTEEKGLLGGGQRHLQRRHDEQAGPADAQVEHVCRPTVEVQGERGVRGGREAEDRRVVQELPPAAGCGGVCTRPELRRRRSPPAPGGSLMQIGIVLGFLTGCPAVALLLERGTKVAV